MNFRDWLVANYGPGTKPVDYFTDLAEDVAYDRCFPTSADEVIAHPVTTSDTSRVCEHKERRTPRASLPEVLLSLCSPSNRG